MVPNVRQSLIGQERGPVTCVRVAAARTAAARWGGVKMTTRYASVIALACLLLYGTAFGQDGAAPELTAEQQQTLAKMKALWQSLDRRTGKITLGSELATLDVPDDFYYLGPKDAERVLVEAWGNPPGQDTLGMLFPAGQTPFDRDAWAVTIEYDEDGHVSDSDAASINYGELLTEMRDSIREANPGRETAGYQPIELV